MIQLVCALLQWSPISGSWDKCHLQESHTHLIAVPDCPFVCVCVHMVRCKDAELLMPWAWSDREPDGTARTGTVSAAH